VVLVLLAGSVASAATFGNIVTTVGGHPADIALDESRGALYLANFTALRIDVMSISSRSIQASIPLSSHPSGIALSQDSTYLVVTEYENGTSTPQGWDGVTVINLNTGAMQNFATGEPALGVAFGAASPVQDAALIATSTGLYLLDPALGSMQFLVSFPALAIKALPVPLATFPPQIVGTQLTASADGLWIWGVADAGAVAGSSSSSGSGTDTEMIFSYNTQSGSFVSQIWQNVPPLLPRVSVAADGSWAMIGWAQFAPAQCGGGFMIPSRYPQPLASVSIGGHAVNASNGVTDTIYAQIFDSSQPGGPPYTGGNYPTLSIMDADNLTVRDRIYMPENVVGRAVLDGAGNVLYAISDSGVMVLPVGLLSQYPRLAVSQEDLLVQTNFCNQNPLTATFGISDAGNNSTAFSISTSQTGVLVSPSSGKTPATITVTVQPGAIPDPGGTLAVPLTLNSTTAVNVPPSVRLLISNPDPDQRGAIVDVPGHLVDLLPDLIRNRLYVLRQDKNEALIFDGSSYQQLAAVRTPTTPTGMTLTSDGNDLLIAGADSQLIEVYDLDAMQPQTVNPAWWNSAAQPATQMPVQLPTSHYGRSVAQSTAATLALIENDGEQDCLGADCAIDQLDLSSRCAFSPPTLGVYANDNAALPPTSVLSPSGLPGPSWLPPQNQGYILVTAPNGNVMLYDANAVSGSGTFTLSRKDLSSLSGAYAVSPGGDSSTTGPPFPTSYVIGDNVFDASLVPQGTLDTSVGNTYGFAYTTAAGGYRLTGTTASSFGVIQNLVSVEPASSVRPVRTVEAPALSSTIQPFTRTIAPLLGGIALLTTSGMTLLAPGYDAAVVPPSISAVVSAADGSPAVAPGGLISIYGDQLSPATMAFSQMPLPFTMAGSCVSANGVPIPLLWVSGQQVNAQMPFEVSGSAGIVVHAPGGTSGAFNLPVSPTAPSIFDSGTAGPLTGIPEVVRASNHELVTDSNPIHPNDTLTIYLSGLGQTSPPVATGAASPASPLACAVIAPTVTLGGVDLPVSFAGLSPGMVGVYEMNVTVPFEGIPTGFDIPLVVSQGGVSTSVEVRVIG
jgi:uncharacterized protein (TIGR03437 family)